MSLNENQLKSPPMGQKCDHCREFATVRRTLKPSGYQAGMTWYLDFCDEHAKKFLSEIPDAPADNAQAVLQKCVALLKRYVLAMDAIYNHHRAARAAVALHFGTTHPGEVWDIIGVDPLHRETLVAPSVVVGVEENQWKVTYLEETSSTMECWHLRDEKGNHLGTFQDSIIPNSICEAHNASLGEPREKEDSGEPGGV